MYMSRSVVAVMAVMGFFALSASVVQAQPGQYAPPPPPNVAPQTGYFPASGPPPAYVPAQNHRRGLVLGFGVGLGQIADEGGTIQCAGCEVDSPAALGEFHVGYMINPRLAFVFEFWGSSKELDANGAVSLAQYMGFGAAQYWVSRRLWIKGGIGVSQLELVVDDGQEVFEEPKGEGGALMGAIGYELYQGRRFALDLQLRVATATYAGEGESDEQVIQTGSFGLGFNWY